jgi:hypothetical protein
VLFFPRVLVQLVRLKRRARHETRRSGLVDVSLDALPQGMELSLLLDSRVVDVRMV